jgi:hypothetical protein
MTWLVVLDNEAVQALASPHHPKHRKVLAHLEVVERRKRHAVAISLVVPAAVRVEAGWDRTSPQWAPSSTDCASRTSAGSPEAA